MMTTLEKVRTRQEWAERISERSTEAAAAIIAIGVELLEAREDLGVEFYDMVAEDLSRSRRWAEQLMSIARNTALTDPKHVSQLPADTLSLYQLSRLTPEVIEANIETGAISPDLKRVEYQKLRQMLSGGGSVFRDPERRISLENRIGETTTFAALGLAELIESEEERQTVEASADYVISEVLKQIAITESTVDGLWRLLGSLAGRPADVTEALDQLAESIDGLLERLHQ